MRIKRNTLKTHNDILPLTSRFHGTYYDRICVQCRKRHKTTLADVFNAITNPVTIATVKSIIFRASVFGGSNAFMEDIVTSGRRLRICSEYQTAMSIKNILPLFFGVGIAWSI